MSFFGLIEENRNTSYIFMLYLIYFFRIIVKVVQWVIQMMTLLPTLLRTPSTLVMMKVFNRIFPELILKNWKQNKNIERFFCTLKLYFYNIWREKKSDLFPGTDPNAEDSDDESGSGITSASGMSINLEPLDLVWAKCRGKL